jgi:fructokinase
MEKSSPVIVGIGELLWDFLPTGKRIGGAPANFVYHTRMWGATAYMLSSIGDDEHGRQLLAELDRISLDRSFVQIDSSHPTGTVSIELDGEGKPSYIIHENAAWDHIGYSSELDELARHADAVCFGSLAQRLPVSRDTIRRFIAKTRGDCLHIADINLRGHYYDAEIIDHSLQVADVLKLNDEELPIVAGLLGIYGEECWMLERLQAKYDLRLIALTRGADGALLLSREERSECSGIPADLVDTVGAGDAFTAALAMGMLRREPLDAINRQACQLASYVCSRSGAMPEPPHSMQSPLRGMHLGKSTKSL